MGGWGNEKEGPWVDGAGDFGDWMGLRIVSRRYVYLLYGMMGAGRVCHDNEFLGCCSEIIDWYG